MKRAEQIIKDIDAHATAFTGVTGAETSPDTVIWNLFVLKDKYKFSYNDFKAIFNAMVDRAVSIKLAIQLDEKENES